MTPQAEQARRPFCRAGGRTAGAPSTDRGPLCGAAALHQFGLPIIRVAAHRKKGASMAITSVKAIQTFFEKDGGRKVSMHELKALTDEDKTELGRVRAAALGEEFTEPVAK